MYLNFKLEYISIQDTNQFNPFYDDEKKLNDIQIQEYRKRKEKEKKVWNSMREIIFYLMFIWLIFLVSYSKKDINSYKYQSMLKNLFKTKRDCNAEICFENVCICFKNYDF